MIKNIDELIIPEWTPKYPEDHIDQLVDNTFKYGISGKPEIDTEGVIITGYDIVIAAKACGIKRIDVIVISDAPNFEMLTETFVEAIGLSGQTDEVKKKGMRGRRSKFEVTEYILNEIMLLSQGGMKMGQIRQYYGVSKSAWARKCQKTGICAAYDMGQSRGVAFSSGQLMEHVKRGNLDAIKFHLIRVGKYTENPAIIDEDGEEKTVAKPRTLVIDTNDPIEASKIYQEFMKGSSKDE